MSISQLRVKPKNTEDVDDRFRNIARLPTPEALRLIWEAQAAAVKTIERALPQIAAAVPAMVEAISFADGRLIGIGAGTSGRLIVQNLTELTPTFGLPPHRRIGLMAGGKKAVFRSVEGAEDNARAGEKRVKALRPGAHDVVIGVAASGRTPFAIGGLNAAREAGAVTIALSNVEQSALGKAAQFKIEVPTGAEVIAGSTRMGAGTVQKVVLDMITTETMVGLGKVFEGRMVDMQATNEKLVRRASLMVQDLTGCDEPRAKAMLAETKGWIKPTILMGRFNMSARAAERMLERHSGHLHRCVDALTPINAP